MRYILNLSVSFFLVVLLFPSAVISGEKQEGGYKGSENFERLKQMVGVWEGTTSMGDGKEDQKVTVEYRLTSGDSAVVETFFPGTPHEMVSVYYDQGGSLAMTHYCMLGNQPQMDLKTADSKKMDFELSSESKIDSNEETHMHALTISFIDSNNLVEKWTLYENGVEKESTSFKLTRVN